MSKLKEKSKISTEKIKKDHGTRNMIIFLVIFSIVCIGVTSFLILKNNNSKISNVMENIKENVSIPVIAKPNAGMPVIDEKGNAVYSMNAEEFAHHMKVLIENGASVVGGCCGTTPSFIKALHDTIR